MNRTHTLLAIAFIAAVIVGWQLRPGSPSRVEPAPAFGTGTGAASAATPLPDTPQPTPPTIPSIERTPVAGADDARSAAAQLLERNGCQVTEQRFDPGTAELRDVYTCPSRAPEAHPYESWSDDTLANLAYGDPKAAEILGLRHVISDDPGEEAMGLALLYRSAALSGDPDVFHKAIGRRYAYLSVNGEPQLHNLRQLLIFSLIGHRLQGKAFDPTPIENRLREAEVPGQDITQLHAVAGRILRSMGDLQREITGNTTIEEAIADA